VHFLKQRLIQLTFVSHTNISTQIKASITRWQSGAEYSHQPLKKPSPTKDKTPDEEHAVRGRTSPMCDTQGANKP